MFCTASSLDQLESEIWASHDEPAYFRIVRIYILTTYILVLMEIGLLKLSRGYGTALTLLARLQVIGTW